MKIQHKKPVVKKPKNDDKGLWIIIGVTTLVLGGVGYWYYRKRKKKSEMFPSRAEDLDREIASTIANNTTRSPSITRRPTRFKCSSRGYPLEYGTCYKDVKILQSYLSKIYKADLGRSGSNKDGVDGMFGNKTNKAAKKHLQKTSFNKQDIDGMRTAIKMIKR